MANSYTLYNGNGATTDFTVSFPYINQAHITLLVSGVTVAATWISTTTLRATVAPAVGVTNVKVKRTTPKTSLVTFSDSSGLTAADLNLQGTQARYIAEEQEDAYLAGGLTDLSVTTLNLQAGVVTTPKLADLAVTTAKLENLSVTSAKLNLASVTLDKMANLSARTFIGKQTGTGAPEALNVDDLKILSSGSTTARDLKTRFSEVYNVKDYGAVGNGVADDATAINAAITAASGKTWGVGGEFTGAIVFFPGGRYQIGSPLVIPANSGVALVGEGKTKSNIFPVLTSQTLISMPNSNNSRMFLRGLRLHGGSAAFGIAVDITGYGNQIDIRDCWIDTIAKAISGVPNSDSYITDCTLEYTAQILQLTLANDITITNNTFVDCGPIALGAGVFAPLIDLNLCLRIGILNNRIISTSGMSAQTNGIVRMTSCKNCSYSGNISNDELSYIGPYLIMSGCDRTLVSNNQMGLSYSATIKDTDSVGLVITGNSFKGASQAGVKTIDLTGTIGFIVSLNYFVGGSGSYDIQAVNGTAATSNGIIQGNVFALGYNIITTCGPINLFNNVGGTTRNFLTAAPTAGTWKLGDVVYHSIPSGSGNLGWVCTTAGSPGTWKSWGTISP